MKTGQKAALVCCSNGLTVDQKPFMRRLQKKLIELGISPVLSEHLYEKEACFSGSGKERAAVLQHFFSDPEIRMIFDVSGGDIANELLPFLDYQKIAASRAIFCGYSDLTTLMNAIYTKTGKPSLWYQAKHLLGNAEQDASRMFTEAFLQDAEFLEDTLRGSERTRKKAELFCFHTKFLQGNTMQGILVGGNIRCFLKLAGTPYWPDMKGKILFLEARSGSQAQMTAYLNQLKQMGVFEQISGILLGTFLQMEKEAGMDSAACVSMSDLVKRCVGESLAVVCTEEVGHRSSSKAVWIGGNYIFSRKKTDANL